MGPRLPPSLKLRRAQLYNPGEALAETGREDDKLALFSSNCAAIDVIRA
jgi:hypothetical protein